jgi:hypothetical protein
VVACCFKYRPCYSSVLHVVHAMCLGLLSVLMQFCQSKIDRTNFAMMLSGECSGARFE